MLQLHGIPVPSTALPRVPRDSSSLYSPAALPCPSAGTRTNSQPQGVPNVRFMSSMGSRRIYARNAGSGTVASVHQFHLEDTATTMEADDYAMQSTSQDMEAAVQVILQEIGEDVERPVSHPLPAPELCTQRVSATLPSNCTEMAISVCRFHQCVFPGQELTFVGNVAIGLGYVDTMHLQTSLQHCCYLSACCTVARHTHCVLTKQHSDACSAKHP